MVVLGVTGRYCAGKNTVAEFLEHEGFLHLDADKLAHEALQRQRARVEERFGSGVVAEGRVNRRALAAVVFSDEKARIDLEGIVHPEVVRMIGESIAEHRDRDIVINAPLLHKAGLHLMCRAVLWVDAPAAMRMYRAMRRDRYSIRAIARRMRSQASLKLAQHSDGDVDIIRVNNVCGRRSLSRRLHRIVDDVRRRPE